MANRLIDFASMVEADQITFRKLYHNGDDNFKETVWVKENQLSDEFYEVFQAYILKISGTLSVCLHLEQICIQLKVCLLSSIMIVWQKIIL
jgi:hypothetical protein